MYNQISSHAQGNCCWYSAELYFFSNLDSIPFSLDMDWVDSMSLWDWHGTGHVLQKCILSCIFRKRSIKFPIIASSRKLNTMEFGVTRTNGLSPFSSTLNRKSPRGSHWKRSLLSTRSSLTHSEIIPSISDHEAIYIEASLRPHKTPTQSRTVVLYKKADF